MASPCRPPWYVRPAHRRSLVTAAIESSQKALQVRLQLRSYSAAIYSIDAGRTTLARQPVGLLHPFQIDDVTQRVQPYARSSPRQFRYLLPFRVQVCRFSVPSHVSRQQLSSMASPFAPPGPFDQVPRLRRYYGDATPSCTACRSLMISLPLPRFLPCFVPRLRAPVRPEAVFPGQGHFHALPSPTGWADVWRAGPPERLGSLLRFSHAGANQALARKSAYAPVEMTILFEDRIPRFQ